MNNAPDVPPWEEEPPLPGDADTFAGLNHDLDVCDASGHVTQGQFSALLQMVKDLKDQVNRLSVQVAGMVNQNPGRPNPAPAPASDMPRVAGDRLARGKYAGLTHAEVVVKDPSYVIYLFQNGWHVNWGFTNQHLADAKMLTNG